MAIMHCQAQIISRKAGRSSTGAAAYRACEKIIDERDGTVHDYTRKRGLIAAEVVMPSGLTWQPTRAELWNAVELRNKRADAQVAREFDIALPAELTDEQRLNLTRSFALHITDTYKVAADFAIHKADRRGDQRNYHAHVLITTNTVNDYGLGNKAREMDNIAHMRGNNYVQSPKNAIEQLREFWATAANAALEAAEIADRIDHRSLKAQGINRVPQIHVGVKATAMARRGVMTERYELNQSIIKAARVAEQERLLAALEAQRELPSGQPVEVYQIAGEKLLQLQAADTEKSVKSTLWDKVKGLFQEKNAPAAAPINALALPANPPPMDDQAPPPLVLDQAVATVQTAAVEPLMAEDAQTKARRERREAYDKMPEDTAYDIADKIQHNEAILAARPLFAARITAEAEVKRLSSALEDVQRREKMEQRKAAEAKQRWLEREAAEKERKDKFRAALVLYNKTGEKTVTDAKTKINCVEIMVDNLGFYDDKRKYIKNIERLQELLPSLQKAEADRDRAVFHAKARAEHEARDEALRKKSHERKRREEIEQQLGIAPPKSRGR